MTTSSLQQWQTICEEIVEKCNFENVANYFMTVSANEIAHTIINTFQYNFQKYVEYTENTYLIAQ